MSHDTHEDTWSDIGPLMGVFGAGLLIGGLAGAVTMLFVAPQSGERTRRQVRRKALQVRDRLADNAEEARDQAEESLDGALKRVRQVGQDARQRVDDVQQRSRDFIDEQSGRVKDVVETGKKSLRH